MSISPVSVHSSANQPQAPSAQPPGKSEAKSQLPDTVSLSPTASAQLKGGDVDHDGDSH